MMRHTLLTLSILLTAVAAQAAPITEAEARANVWQFLNSKGKQKIKGAQSLTLMHTIYKDGESQADGSPMLYIFNVNGDKGFVVAAADDVALPILAYGNEGGFSQGHIPDNVQAWLQGYADQIAAAKASGASTPRMERPTKSNRQSVDYMIQVKWDQLAPYNDQCVFDGHKCPTGCVATAMAQIMYYWAVTGRDGNKFRHGCQALDSYNFGYEVPALDAIDSFDWDAMDEGSMIPHSDAAKQAVAQLMRYCGQSAYMKYTTESSSTNHSSAISGMKKFGYSSKMRYVDKYDHTNNRNLTYDEWEDLLYKEIRKERPVMMGLSTHTMNHFLVCDGYDAENNSFHLNWGWSGDCDGYYVLSTFIVNSGAIDNGYVAVVGIEPEASTYGVLSSDGHTLTLYYDNKKEQRPGEIIECNLQTEESDESLRWEEALGDKVYDVQTIVIDESFKNTSNYLNGYFCGLQALQEIKGLKYLDTYGASGMDGMFQDCYSLQHLDLSQFDTSQVTSMESMFFNCFSLQDLDLSSFDTSNVISMNCMFCNCHSLEKVDVSHFDTSNVVDMNRMFQRCISLTELDLSNFVIRDAPTDPDDPDRPVEWLSSCDTEGLLLNCSGLRKLHISPSLGLLQGADDDDFFFPACKGVGTESKPCVMYAPSGFDFGTDTGSTFQWKGGWFHLPYPIGDINHDEQVNVTDVTLLVNYILKSNTDEYTDDDFYKDAADVNGDGQINITDVTNLVNIILQKQGHDQGFSNP